MEIILDILIALIVFGIIVYCSFRQEKINEIDQYYNDNIHIPFHFDEVNKNDRYFKYVYGDNYKDGLSFKTWKKNGKKDIKRDWAKELRRSREWDELEKKYNYKK
jgi:hypothetical protein